MRPGRRVTQLGWNGALKAACRAVVDAMRDDPAARARMRGDPDVVCISLTKTTGGVISSMRVCRCEGEVAESRIGR